MIFQCISKTYVKWSFEDGHLLSNVDRLQNSIQINSASLSNTGTYECVGTTDSELTFYSEIILNILSKRILHTMPKPYCNCILYVLNILNEQKSKN